MNLTDNFGELSDAELVAIIDVAEQVLEERRNAKVEALRSSLTIAYKEAKAEYANWKAKQDAAIHPIQKRLLQKNVDAALDLVHKLSTQIEYLHHEFPSRFQGPIG